MRFAIAALQLLFAVCAVLADDEQKTRREWLPDKYTCWSRAKTHSLIMREDGVTEFRHTGATEWTLDCFPRIPVRPGEPFTFTCRSERVTDGAATRPFSIEAVLYDSKGQVMAWHWGSVPIQPGDEGSTTFLVPNGVATLQPRFSGVGYFAGAFPLARFERAENVEAVTREVGLTPFLTVSSDMLAVSFATSNGVFSVTDRRTGRTWSSAKTAQTARRTIVIQSAIRKTMFAARFVDAEDLFRYTLVCRLEADAPEFTVMLMADPDTRLGEDPIAFPPPFETQKGDRLVVPYGEGVGIPVDQDGMQMWRYAAFSGDGLCMPFFGVAEDASGAGWMTILETPDDAYGICSRTVADKFWTISPGWIGQKGCFGYTRRVRYVFFDKGGHVAMANRYRAYAKGMGLVKTLGEKAKERPSVASLPGAVDVWYFPGKGDPDPLKMAKNLKSAGVERFIWGQGTTEHMVRETSAMDGVLVGSHDCYRDVYHVEQLKQLGWSAGPNSSAWPKDVNWGGEQPQDWRRTRAVKAKNGAVTHCAMMCDIPAPVHARKRIAGELSRKPFTARFIDGVMSGPWQECFNPAHPMSRSDSRYWRMELLRIVGDDFKLVVGSAKGLDSCVPYCDYLEGMLTLDSWSMPSGDRHVNFAQKGMPSNVSVKKLDDVAYKGLSPSLRLPLWELVYHDCCVAHWSWHDYSNWPLDLWMRRDLFNVLYGTPGMFVFDGALWQREKDRFVASYNRWSPVARKTGFSRMTNHLILSPDRLVQQTVFADGTTVTVNFGDKPFDLPDGTSVEPQAFTVR